MMQVHFVARRVALAVVALLTGPLLLATQTFDGKQALTH